jgi:Sec-independent protein translocase protein TatA
MAYGLIRIRELGRSELVGAQTHNAREYDDKNIIRPENIDHAKSHNNWTIYENGNSIQDCIDARFLEAGVKERSNSVVAIEFVVGASPDFFDAYSASGHFSNCAKWLKEKYGEKNVVARFEHYDESTPHCHFIVTPVIEKEVKWKNSNGQGTKIQNSLCARDLTGNKDKLKDLQQAYFDFIKPYGKNYGIKFQDRTPAEQQIKNYTKHTNHELGLLRNYIASIDKNIGEVRKGLAEGKIEAKTADQKLTELEQKIKSVEQTKSTLIKNHQEKESEINQKASQKEFHNKNGKWKKGKDFDVGF